MQEQYPPDAYRSAVAKLREGTEILRTGGGITLTAAQCLAVLNTIEQLRNEKNLLWEQMMDETAAQDENFG